MSMQLKKSSFRGFGKMGEVSTQTAVECRFGGEVETVLFITVSLDLLGAECGNGEVRYFGKAVFCMVYEDGEKHVCRAEKGVEFNAKAVDEKICPGYTARVTLRHENTSVRREGASVYATALIGGEVCLFGEQNFEYLSDGDLVLKREEIKVIVSHLCGGETEEEDEFEADYLGDILAHTENVNITGVSAARGELNVEGEVNLCVLALREDGGILSFERLIPFRAEIPCEDDYEISTQEASVTVKNITLRAETDEESGKSTIRAQLTLSVRACVYEEVRIEGATDAFSTEREVNLHLEKVHGYGVGKIERRTERVSGKAILSSEIDFSDSLQAITLQRAEGNIVRTAEGKAIEGVAMATVLVRGADGSHRGVEMSLPFSIPYDGEGESVSLFACGTSARQRQEGELEGEVTLKICTAEEWKTEAEVVVSAEEGKEWKKSDSAISIYLPHVGDGLWELSKRLKSLPQEVEEQNPDLEFPLKEGERVLVYRKKC